MKAEIKDTRKYCKFHEDYGHETDGCRDLKVEIERMIDVGELRKFIAHKTKSSDKGEKRSRDDKGKEKEEERPSKILGTIHMINGGGHNSSTIRKKQRREVMNIRETHMPSVIFYVEDYEHVKAPHNDTLVVTTIIKNWNMNKVAPSTDPVIRTRRPLNQPTRCRLTGSHNRPGKGDQQEGHALFNIVGMELTYNAILGRPFLYDSAAVTSIRALAMTVPTEKGVVTLRGDQNIAKKCYDESVVDFQENKTEKKGE
ncbi:uncharacterized protein LOC126687645 [Mercurialis annua]|uniref:uncharacterized protein LOC126687645 n=1 Tax=Mercurialis annua TaxID=3986 RepID=UPI00215E309B|nr:uncharacterized protein LOC126687645 [Mercurialis annua]